ncbi:acyloxyacyl hydrolase [Pelagibacteraceae bacterium]|nr:acyloxyacyl hydrolase [Pelagibacteraceae bacterium]
MIKIFFFLAFVLISNVAISKGTNVFGIGIYDVKFDGSEKNQATDFRYEYRSDKTLFDIGPEEDNFFFLKPFFGFEYTNDSASYFLTGIYIEDNIGELFEGNKSKLFFTPSFGAGIYNDGSGKKLGNDLQFRTALEVSYELKNKNRIGISFSHISNANLGDKNPGVEILSFSYQIPY